MTGPPSNAQDHRDPAECLDQALADRRSLLADPSTDTCRIFNAAADGIPGLVIEKFGEVLVAQLHEGRLSLSEAQTRNLCAGVQQVLGARAVYRKIFAQERSRALPALDKLHRDPTPWLGDAVEDEIPVLENCVRYLFRPYDGYSVGLFLEHRDNRRRLRELAAGRTVLNAFAYTCSFSVATALGHAAATTSVDVSKRYLEWGKRNFAANGLDLAAHKFICSDIFDYYRRAERQRHRFDLVILDPPTFGRARRPKRTFVLTEDLDALIAGAVKLLNPGGYLLLATNHRGTSRKRLETAVVSATGGHAVQSIERLRLPLDFAGDRGYAKALLVRLG
jgi:23S rRNA (cytosine1962-C5)-methyltransferase